MVYFFTNDWTMEDLAGKSIQPVDDLLTTKQLQDLLQVDRVTIYRMLKDGRLEGFKVGGQWRFSRQAIQQWLGKKQAVRGPLTSPEIPGRADDLQLPSSSCMQAIQDIFAEALGIGAVITAAEGACLTAISHPCSFCRMVLGTGRGHQRCLDFWSEPRAAAQTAPSSWPTTCHAGLNYLSAPIQVQGQVVAAIQAGQFLSGVSEPLADRQGPLAELAAATGLEAADLAQALAAVPRLDKERLQQVSDLLQRVARALSEMAEERLHLVGRLQRISEISQIR